MNQRFAKIKNSYCGQTNIRPERYRHFPIATLQLHQDHPNSRSVKRGQKEQQQKMNRAENGQ